MELTNFIIKKKEYIPEGGFIDILESIKNDNNNTENFKNVRNLYEKEISTPGVNEDYIFFKSIDNIDITLNLRNDLGLSFLEKAKSLSNYKIKGNSEEMYQELSHNEIYTKLYEL